MVVRCIVLSHTADNFIDGEEFFKLSADEISKMVMPIGLVKKIARLVMKVFHHSI